ncbi:grainyhead-like, partial [Haplosporangium sp. Z 27]
GAERKNKDDHKHLEKMWDKMRGKNADTNPLVNILAPVQSMSLFSECLDHPEGSGEEETLDLSDTLNYETGIEGSGGDGESTHSNNERASSSRPGSEDSNLAVVPVNKKRRRDTDGGANSLVDNNSINHSSNNSNNGSGTFYDPQQSQVGFPSSAQSSNSLVIAGSNNGSSALITSEQFLDRDPNYVPISRKKRPVLCLYIKIGGESVYRAVYLEKYTLTDLISKLSEKLEIQSSTISCVYRKTIKKELLVRVDDAMVAQMTDELDMVVEYDFNQQDGS